MWLRGRGTADQQVNRTSGFTHKHGVQQVPPPQA
jgi:hypothetical protein